MKPPLSHRFLFALAAHADQLAAFLRENGLPFSRLDSQTIALHAPTQKETLDAITSYARHCVATTNVVNTRQKGNRQ